jgi:hypothetical protein
LPSPVAKKRELIGTVTELVSLEMRSCGFTFHSVAVEVILAVSLDLALLPSSWWSRRKNDDSSGKKENLA